MQLKFQSSNISRDVALYVGLGRDGNARDQMGVLHNGVERRNYNQKSHFWMQSHTQTI